MDTKTYSARQAALRLGTSIPRIKRAIAREGIEVAEGPAGRIALTEEQVERLCGRLGVTPAVEGLTRTEGLALAALARAPLGVVSARALAGRSGLSPTAASRAARSLEAKQLVTVQRRRLPAGRVRDVDVIRAAFASPRWPAVASKLAGVRIPEPAAVPERRVPERLGYLFWNTAPSQLDAVRAGGYVARRLIATDDPEGLAWGAANLSAHAWRDAARARGIDASQRALARNLAASRSPR